MRTTAADWFRFAKKLQNAGDRLAGRISIPNTNGLHDPKVVATLLLFRSRANFLATLKLVRSNMVVEARVVARCCYENQFFVAALAEEGSAFVNEMKNDERQSRKMRGQFLLEQTLGADSDLTERLRAYLRGITREGSNLRWLNPRDVAGRGPLLKAYVFYSQLSADSGHPSLEALDRHIDKTEIGDLIDVHGFSVEPRIGKGEAAETLRYVCQAVLGTYVGVNQILECGAVVDKELRVLWNEYNALTGVEPGALLGQGR